MTVGQRIKLRRLELGLTQLELAERVNVKYKSSISKIENSVNPNITSDVLQKYADALNTTPLYLMGLCDDPNQVFTLEDVEDRGARDGELLNVIRQLNDVNAKMLLEFAKTLLSSQE